MKHKIFFLIICMLFMASCEFYKHTNPYDPDYEGTAQKLTSLPDIKVSSIYIYDDCIGVTYCNYGFRITIENKGKGSVELPLSGILSTRDPKISMGLREEIFPYGFKTTQPITYFKPGDKVETFFFIEKQVFSQIPYTFNLILTLKDKNNNVWVDSVKAVIDFQLVY